ncbi:MAG: ABC transporter ATP-binding protein [Treponema sp.]|jgi:NitT/TauT family transport system ATP-binding protein|nr:ABC transporter ATP-binding protein [Treponema sp.]
MIQNPSLKEGDLYPSYGLSVDTLNLSIKKLCFAFGNNTLFNNFSLELNAVDSPLMVLGPSGCGKTTLLRLIAGLLTPASGLISAPKVSFAFQEPRLFPQLTTLENAALPLEAASLSKSAALERARYFLELVSLSDKASEYPPALSGGQAQRVSIARAFAYPAPLLLMDEPFQSLDIPLRIELMEILRRALNAAPRFLLAVTHDPREAIFLGKRVIVLGKTPRGLVFDETINLRPDDRVYGTASPAANALERKLLRVLGGID